MIFIFIFFKKNNPYNKIAMESILSKFNELYDDDAKIVILEKLEYDNIIALKLSDKKHLAEIDSLITKYANFWEEQVKDKNPSFTLHKDITITYEDVAKMRSNNKYYFQYGSANAFGTENYVYGALLSYHHNYHKLHNKYGYNFYIITPDLNLYTNPNIMDLQIPLITDLILKLANSINNIKNLDVFFNTFSKQPHEQKQIFATIMLNNHSHRIRMPDRLLDIYDGYIYLNTKFI